MTDPAAGQGLPSLPALEALNTENAAALVEALQDLIDLVWALHGDRIGALWAKQETARLSQPDASVEDDR